jgi:hypothetical protein
LQGEACQIDSADNPLTAIPIACNRITAGEVVQNAAHPGTRSASREGCKHDGTENAAAAGNQIVIDVPLPSSLDSVTRLQPMNRWRYHRWRYRWQ